MTSTPELQPLEGRDDPASVLAFARGRKQAEARSARDVMLAAASWLSMHAAESLVGPVDDWHEKALPLGGEGCPEIAEFAITEFAAALGMSPDSGRRYLAKAAEGAYRLTACWERLEAGHLEAWRLGFIAERTMCLSPAAARFVDVHVAPVAHKIGPAQLMRLIEEAKARFDPDQAEAERLAAAERRHVTVGLADAGLDGVAFIDGGLDLADALDLETAVADLADQLLLAGSTESHDVRRSLALGMLARGEVTLALHDGKGDRPVQSRRLVLHVHISEDAVRGAGGLARLDEARTPITAAQVRDWCGRPDAAVVVKPVIDLTAHVHVDAYEVPDRLRDQIRLRDLVCVHPYCTRRAIRADCDHRVDHDLDNPDRGPTCSCNLAPLCRPHHRSKTTGGWTYVTVEPGVYLWRSPLGYQFLCDHTGTLDVTPDEDRRRNARELIAHFGDHPPET